MTSVGGVAVYLRRNSEAQQRGTHFRPNELIDFDASCLPYLVCMFCNLIICLSEDHA